MMMGMNATMARRRTAAGGIRRKGENKIALYYDWKTGTWGVKKAPYVCIEIETEEDCELLKKMVAYWHEHHDAEGNEIG